MRVCSSQSARSQIPGSRSSQRPCVSAMSSAPGVKTSKMKRPSRREQAADRAQRRAAIVVGLHVQQRAERDQRRAGTRRRPAASACRPGAGRARRPPSSARSRATASIPAERSTPTTSIPAAAIGTRDAAGADAELEHRPARAHRFGDVERHVLDDAPRPRVVEAGDLVVGRHLGIALQRCRRRTRTCLCGPGARAAACASAFGLTRAAPPVRTGACLVSPVADARRRSNLG